MSVLVIEMWNARTAGILSGEWQRLGRIFAGEPAGSMSNNAGDGRQIISFRCEQSRAVIERSIGGADVDIGRAREQRLITTIGFETIAELRAGETHEMQLQTDRMSEPATIRFRMEGDADVL